MLSSHIETAAQPMDATNDMDQQLRLLFGQGTSEESLRRLRDCMRVYGVAAETLWDKHEALLVNNPRMGTLVSDASLDSLRDLLNADLDARLKASTANSFLAATFINSSQTMFSDNSLETMLNSTSSQRPTKTKAKMRVAGASQQQQQQQQPSRAPTAPPPRTPHTNRFTSQVMQPPLTSSPVGPASQLLHSQFKPTPAKIGSGGTPSASMATPVVAFKDRRDKDKMDHVLNPHVPRALNSDLDRKTANVDISLAPGQQMNGYRYMFERLTEKGDLVDARIEELSLVLDSWILENVAKKSENRDDYMDNEDETNRIQDPEFASFKVLQNPCLPHQDRFYTAGRIVMNITHAEAESTTKLTADTLQLETCRSLGGGNCTLLALMPQVFEHEKGSLGLFPGMIVGLSGTNPKGDCMLVDQVFKIPQVAFATTRADRILDMYTPPSSILPATLESDEGAKKSFNGHDGGSASAAKPVNIVIAAGPFSVQVTGQDVPSYEPLEALTAVVENERPDVVILCGPFVDEALCVQAPFMRVEPERLFRERIVPCLKRMTAVSAVRSSDGMDEDGPTSAAPANASTRVVLVPSTRGLESEWIGYPQPPLASACQEMSSFAEASVGREQEEKIARWREFGIKDLVVSGKIVLVPNPCQLSVNEIVIAVSNVDSMMHLSNQEVVFGKTSLDQPDRTSRLFAHHLTQRHLYPLSHAPANLSDFGASLFALDATRAQSGAITLQATPDVFVLPSLLGGGNCRIVDGCVCVNPGLVVKGRAGGGTFARMCVHPLDMDELKKLRGGNGGGGRSGGAVGGKRKAENEDMDIENGKEEEEDEDYVVLEHSVASRCRVEIQKV